MPAFYSPAKINLFLKVLGKRADGYHELETLMQAIDLFDEITIEAGAQDKFTSDDPLLPLDERNLVLKALSLFRRKTGIDRPLRIHLKKRIPVQAGLGGGSGNAATTLWALNHLLEAKVTDSQLMLWSQEIGSDIPFFFSMGAALCLGRGEEIHPLDSLPTQMLWIVKPSIGLSTPQVYKKYTPRKQTHTKEQLIKSFTTGGLPCINDLEIPAFELIPELNEIKQQLQRNYSTVLLSGSGTSFFCIGNENAPPQLPNCKAIRSRYAYRSQEGWYELPSKS